jgi:Phosphoribosylformylglycinamidine (FGAM) synthase, synthetase domain
MDIGEGWACSLDAQDHLIHCYYNGKTVAKVDLKDIMRCSGCLETQTETPKETTPPSGKPFSVVSVPEPKSLLKVAKFLHTRIHNATETSSAYIVQADEAAYNLVIALGGSSRYAQGDTEIENTLATAEAAQHMSCTAANPVAFFKVPALPCCSCYPGTGLLGLVAKNVPQSGLSFKQKGDMIYLLGHTVEDLGSSEYLYSYHGIQHSPAPFLHAQEQAVLQAALAEAIKKGLLNSVGSISKGGLFTTLLSAATPQQFGFDITTDAEIREDAFLFGESLGRIMVSVSEKNDIAFVDLMNHCNIQATTLGHVTKGELRVDDISFGFISDF